MNIEVVTVASQRLRSLKILEESCKRFSIDLTILGLGGNYAGNSEKIHTLYQYLKSKKENNIILFTDAYDSFFLKPLDNLEDVINKIECKIIFSVEDNYYYRIQSFIHLLEHPWYRFRYPKSQSRYKKFQFLNSGGFIGRKDDILELIEIAKIPKGKSSDQGYFHKCLINNPGLIGLDYNHEIFTNYGKFATNDRFDISDKGLQNILTGSFPFVFHFPGKLHKGYEYFAKRLNLLTE